MSGKGAAVARNIDPRLGRGIPPLLSLISATPILFSADCILSLPRSGVVTYPISRERGEILFYNKVTAQRMEREFWSSVEAIKLYSRRNIKSVTENLSKVKSQRADNKQ